MWDGTDGSRDGSSSGKSGGSCSGSSKKVISNCLLLYTIKSSFCSKVTANVMEIIEFLTENPTVLAATVACVLAAIAYLLLFGGQVRVVALLVIPEFTIAFTLSLKYNSSDGMCRSKETNCYLSKLLPTILPTLVTLTTLLSLLLSLLLQMLQPLL